MIAVSFTSASAAKAARIANRTVELFLRHEAEAKRAEARKAAEWLSDRLEGLRTDVERDEASVQAYRTRFNLAPSGGTDVVDQQVADINRELVAARGDLAQRQASVAFAHELGAHGRGREGLPEVMNSTVITDLRRQEGELLRSEAELRLTYGEKHPRLQLVHAQREDLAAKISQEADRIVASLESQATTAQARVAALQQQLDGVLGTRTRNREAELQLGELERKAAASQRLYELFLQQSKEAEEAAAIVVPGGRILSRAAVPDSPSTPGLTMFAIFGLISSAMAGGVVGLLRDRLDDRVRDAQQVRAAVGLPCIATIPKLDRRADRPGRKADGGLDAYVEAMRSVLAAMHLRGDGPPRMVLVTSPLPGEGRTTLSASLAAYAARLGRRVLLIDLDTRRGQGGRAEESGLVDRLLGDLPFEDLIRRDDALRVDFIASGRQRGDLMTLLLNGQLRQLLWRLGGCYDLVVVDCPPVLAAADARMLAPIVDRVLLVVRWNTTRIPLLRGAVEALREVGANVAGVVLVQAPSPSLLRARRPVTLRLAASGPEASAADPAPPASSGVAAQVRSFALSARRRRGAAAAPQRAARPRPFGGARERGG